MGNYYSERVKEKITMRTCSSCHKLIGSDVKTCPYCGVSASEREMEQLAEDKAKQDNVYECFKGDFSEKKSIGENLVFANGNIIDNINSKDWKTYGACYRKGKVLIYIYATDTEGDMLSNEEYNKINRLIDKLGLPEIETE